MIFLYLIGIAIVGMSIVLGIEYSASQKPLLQIVKNWCNIDSVHFEKMLGKTSLLIKEHSSCIKKFVLKKKKFLIQWSNNKGNIFRSHVRKKLHPTQNKQKTSHFITKMKQD